MGGTASAADTPQATAPADKRFTFITYEAAPWQITEPDGTTSGMVPFLLNNMGALSGYEITSHSYPYARMSLQIKRGQSDLVISMADSTVQKYTQPCVHFGVFSNVFYTLDVPFLTLLAQHKQTKPSIGILSHSLLAFDTAIPKSITHHWDIKEYTSEAAIFNAVNKKRLDAGLLSLNSYQHLSSLIEPAPPGVITYSGYAKATGWLPKAFAHSQRHLDMCKALNTLSDNGRMNLDSDVIIDALITQETPDITQTPRITPDEMAAKNIVPKLRAFYSK